MALGSEKAGDEMVEMRLYVPGTVENETTKTVTNEDGSEKQEEETEEVSAASAFYEQLKDKANIGQVAARPLCRSATCCS